MVDFQAKQKCIVATSKVLIRSLINTHSTVDDWGENVENEVEWAGKADTGHVETL